MTTMDGGNAVFAGAKNCLMYSGFLLWHPASLYLLHPCNRPRDVLMRMDVQMPRRHRCLKEASPLCTRMYCMPVSPKAPTVGAGAKTGHIKITIFRDALYTISDYGWQNSSTFHRWTTRANWYRRYRWSVCSAKEGRAESSGMLSLPWRENTFFYG